MPVVAEKLERAVRFLEAPKGFIPPPLNPTGAKLETREVFPGVYALLSGKTAVDNSGFIVGDRGVLVVDSHINGTMARQIQDEVKRVTSKPILFLVNTNYHGDHTFGNYAFPPTTWIVANWRTEKIMRDFDEEKEFLLPTVEGDRSVYADVRLRLPEILFDNCLRLDIGGRLVEIWYFGPGNTDGDTVVYVPDAKVAWTGNLILGAGTIPAVLEGRPGEYLETIARFERTLEIERIVPGHGPMTSPVAFGRYMRYLSELIEAVHTEIRAGRSLEETIEIIPLWDPYLPGEEPARTEIGPFLKSMHRLNVQKTYQDIAGR
jgi:glyoxylase-like metal-dependent hydrolase (beta-lactamase superfamily II)